MTQLGDGRGRWAIADRRQFPDELVARAAKHQSTLSAGLDALKKLRFGFPRTIEPATARRWIDGGGRLS